MNKQPFVEMPSAWELWTTSVSPDPLGIGVDLFNSEPLLDIALETNISV